MPATHYPAGVISTPNEMPLLQTVRFVFKNGKFVDATLIPGPVRSGAPITHVALLVSCFEEPKQLPTLMQAGTDAFRAAESEAAALSTTLSRVITDNEEFLDEADLRTITGNQYQIVSYAHRGYGIKGQRIDFVLATGKILRASLMANGAQDFIGAIAQVPHEREAEVQMPWMQLEASPGGRHPAHEIVRQLYENAAQYAGAEIVGIEAEGGPNISQAHLQKVVSELPVTLLAKG